MTARELEQRDIDDARIDRIFDEVDWNKQDEIGNLVHGLDVLIDGNAMDANKATMARMLLDNLVRMVDERLAGV